MSAPRPIRIRFTLLAMLLGMLLSGLSAAALLWAAEDYEYILSNEILRGQAEDYGLRLANGLAVALPETSRLKGFRADDPRLPAAYAGYPVGMHEDPANEDMHIGVFNTDAGRLVFVIDLGDIEAMEQRLHLLVALMLVLGTALSGWLGWLLAGVALRPLRQLAETVDALAVQPQRTQLAERVSSDELGQLAQAIDGYQARLVDADAHEQAFLADASHELRTPLTVIQGAVEVLQDDEQASPAAKARHARLQRGVDDMRNLLEAMLAAARRKPLQPETVAAAAFLEAAAGLALAGRPKLRAQVVAEGTLRLAPREAQLLLVGIIKRMLQGREATALVLSLQHDRVLIRVLPEDAAAAPQLRADSGTGSALLDRLAARLGWTLAVADGGAIELLLAPGPKDA